MSASEPPKKKNKTWLQEIDDQSQNNSSLIECDSSLKSTIERKLHCSKTLYESDLDLDHILSRIPYRSILENLFGSVKIPENMNLPIISKKYEESFMRECRPNETQCIMGNLCECQFIDMCAPFIGVEFRIYNDTQDPQMCVLCSRKTTQKLYYDMCCSGKSPHCVIQRYGNIFGQPGEYAVECMLSCPQGLDLHVMPLAMMSHQRNKYSVHSTGGIKYLQQHRVSYEHFQTPSDITQD